MNADMNLPRPVDGQPEYPDGEPERERLEDIAVDRIKPRQVANLLLECNERIIVRTAEEKLLNGLVRAVAFMEHAAPALAWMNDPREKGASAADRPDVHCGLARLLLRPLIEAEQQPWSLWHTLNWGEGAE